MTPEPEAAKEAAPAAPGTTVAAQIEELWMNLCLAAVAALIAPGGLTCPSGAQPFALSLSKG